MTIHGTRTRFRISAILAAILVVAGGVSAAAGPSGAAAATPASWSTLCTGSIGTANTRLVAGVNCRLVVSGGLVRRYVAYVPASVASSASEAPVVFMFHGSTGTGEQFFKISGWRQTADRQRFIAVFPTGKSYRILENGRMSTKWHDFRLACEVGPTRPRGWPATAPYPADDGAFVDTMIADLDASEQVDRDRLYASGFSNGSAFAQSLAVTHADTFAAVGSWAGSAKECLDSSGNPVEEIVAPHLQNPTQSAIPVALGLGNQDPKFLDAINASLTASGRPTLTEIPLDINVINGGFGAAFLAGSLEQNGLVWEPGTEIAVDDWAGVAWMPWWTPPVSVTAEWSTPAAGNTAGNSFVFMLLDGVAHHYPNARPGKQASLAQSGNVNAADLFWQFFARHTR